MPGVHARRGTDFQERVSCRKRGVTIENRIPRYVPG